MEYTSSAENATMAERRGSRVIFFSPANESCDRRGRVRTWAPGRSRSTIGRTVCAEHQRLLASPAVEHAVGEDMAALEVGGELHLVDGEEGDVEVTWHGLDGGDPIARARWLDLLLAGDERDRFRAHARRDLIVELARQKPQRQPDDAGGMTEHALDREMRLAGVGRPKHGGDAGAAGAGIAVGRRGEGDRHRRPKTGDD